MKEQNPVSKTQLASLPKVKLPDPQQHAAGLTPAGLAPIRSAVGTTGYHQKAKTWGSS